jgi:hypothetical protein
LQNSGGCHEEEGGTAKGMTGCVTQWSTRRAMQLLLYLRKQTYSKQVLQRAGVTFADN